VIGLRVPTAADVPALAALGRDSFVAAFGAMYAPADLATFLAETHAETVIAANLANPARRYMVADRGGVLGGYCQIALACGFPGHARGRNPMELKQLYTAPGAASGGIGTALMNWAMAKFAAAGADEVQISVWSGNLGAQRFYARYGFEKVADITFRVGAQLDEEFLFARIG
jgi:ribosomal protein S18 acetylase RimI-like enzyme